jgi:hypothetical protein
MANVHVGVKQSFKQVKQANIHTNIHFHTTLITVVQPGMGSKQIMLSSSTACLK